MQCRWNAESIHQDAWPDPEDRTPRQGHAQAAPHSSHHNQSSAHDQHADPYPDYAQQHLRPEANPGHTGQDTADYSRHSGYSQNPTKGFQQHQHSYQQDVGAQPYSHEQYNSGYDDHYGYTNAQHAAGRHQEADDGFIQSAPYELYSDPVISSAPYELYPDRGSVTADPYGAHLLASTTHAQGSEDPYYQGSARQGFQAAVGPAAQSQNRDLLSKQKQPDPLAFLNGHSSSSNPTSYPRASGQQHHHVTQKPQQHQAEPYDTSGWDAQDQTEPQAVYGNHHEAQTKQYQAPIRDGQRQRSSQRPPKVSCCAGTFNHKHVSSAQLSFLNPAMGR